MSSNERTVLWGNPDPARLFGISLAIPRTIGDADPEERGIPQSDPKRSSSERFPLRPRDSRHPLDSLEETLQQKHPLGHATLDVESALSLAEMPGRPDWPRLVVSFEPSRG